VVVVFARWTAKLGTGELGRKGSDVHVPLPGDPTARAGALREFAGRWIAIWQDSIVAAGDTPDQVFREIDQQDHPEASVTRVPEPELGIHVGIG